LRDAPLGLNDLFNAPRISRDDPAPLGGLIVAPLLLTGSVMEIIVGRRLAVACIATTVLVCGCLSSSSLTCGDDVRTGTESCDKSDLGGATCADLHFYGQTIGLACKDDCTFDTSGCQGACGDGVKDASELCDGGDLGGADCTTAGFYDGPGLTCSPFCTFDVSGCRGFCGDGMASGPETCDGSDLQGADCKALGFYEAAGLACSPLCAWDTKACSGFCGDGVTNGPELCDGSPPAGRTCLDFGFDRGILGCSALCAASFDGCEELGWKLQPSGTPRILQGVWGTGPTDVFAVGAGGTILHWDGAAWTPMSSPTSKSLGAVWGSSTSDVFAVGAGGTIVHWDGASWSAMSSPTDANLLGVWGSGYRDVYAVGPGLFDSPGVIAHWNGDVWSATTVDTPSLNAVWGSGPNDVFVVGYAGNVLHWDGTQWSKMPLLDNLNAIWGSGPDDVFAVGFMGHVWHWNGHVWYMMGSATNAWLKGVWGTGPNDVYAIEPSGPGAGVVVHWDGVSWSVVYQDSGSPQDVFDHIAAIWGSGRNDVFVVGAANNVLHGKGDSWFVSGLDFQVGGMWASDADHLFVVGLKWDGETYDDVFWRRSGGTSTGITTSILPAPDLRAVWGTGPTDVFVLSADDGTFHWDGVTMSSGNDGANWHMIGADIWGTGPDDVFAVGVDDDGWFSYIVHWDGTAWSPMSAPMPPLSPNGAATHLTGVWGSGSRDVFAVGTGGTILHWNGAQWSTIASNTTADLNDVWGSGSDDVFIVGSAGTVLHFDGTSWSRLQLGTTETLVAVHGSGRGDVFIAAKSILFHARGPSWERVALPLQQLEQVSRLVVTPSRVFVSGVASIAQLDRLTVTCTGPELLCNDGWDNDCDGLADAADPDCAGMVAEQCANLVDDDADGKIDCADPDCANFPSCKKR